MQYSIYAESTPNPEVMKFVANRSLFNRDVTLNSSEEANEMPIAKMLFSFPFIKSIFLSNNFIAITKDNSADWGEIAMQIRTFISEHLNEKGNQELTSNYQIETEKINLESSKDTFSETEKKIQQILDEYIKPAVESDGGSITLDSFKEGVVTVFMQGACSGCPSSTITLKQGIETILKEKIGDEIKEVCAK
jgi:Fe-S cluster biogenesis protein NfuA